MMDDAGRGKSPKPEETFLLRAVFERAKMDEQKHQDMIGRLPLRVIESMNILQDSYETRVTPACSALTTEVSTRHPQAILEMLVLAIDDQIHEYKKSEGEVKAFEALSDSLKSLLAENHVQLQPEQVARLAKDIRARAWGNAERKTIRPQLSAHGFGQAELEIIFPEDKGCPIAVNDTHERWRR